MLKKSYTLALVLLCIASIINAQKREIAGIYYLSGVMETASGIKLNPDSTFQFFFSQGAVDRTGSGKWSVSNNVITMQSDANQNNGFEVIESYKSDKRGCFIEVASENEVLLDYIHISATGKKQQNFVKIDSDGKVKFDKCPSEQIYIYFELCPERMDEIQLRNKNDNVIKIGLLPTVFNVRFNQLELKFNNDYLIGQHPLMEGNKYKYELE